MFSEPLKEENYDFFVREMYDNPSCESESEFQEDLNRIKYIKRLFSRFEKTGELKIRLILNHIIILNNVFKYGSCTRLLFYKLDNDYYGMLKSFLNYLDLMPRTIPEIDLNVIVSDHRIDVQLKEITCKD
jgi:hypothetical protein|tara:strand:- start:1734 stop:2123 length:390 start_codon:yes stop_codon:yes gene_type:complete